MAKLVDLLKKIVGGESEHPDAPRSTRPDPKFVGRSSTEDIEEASPERAGELAGHAVERVDT